MKDDVLRFLFYGSNRLLDRFYEWEEWEIVLVALVIVVIVAAVFGGVSSSKSAKVDEAKAKQPETKQHESLTDKLTKLAELRDKGILTEEEFAAQKAKLLAE